MGAASVDRFGNARDPSVGYARGRILTSALEESRRASRAQVLIRERTESGGLISIFTGNPRAFPIDPADISELCEEWIGRARIAPALEHAISGHLGGSDSASVAAFNRTSAGMIAAVYALARGGRIVTLAAHPSATHVCVYRGARLAGAQLEECVDLKSLTAAVASRETHLVVITSYSSDLDELAPEVIAQAVEIAHTGRQVPVILDDAYGARLRPYFQGGPASLELGVDLAISNSDKAGMPGPRGGFMAGRSDLIERVSACAQEFGQEARAPLAVAILRSLQAFSEATLREEIEDGSALHEALSARLGPGRIKKTPLGPLVSEDEILEICLERADEGSTPEIFPAEASAALGMILLRDWGLLTVNALGAPGARVSLRLKAVPGSLAAYGGAGAVAQAVDEALDAVASIAGEPSIVRELLLGADAG
jgi:L-seryl-tRNA(Ser) seleniumtransferase